MHYMYLFDDLGSSSSDSLPAIFPSNHMPSSSYHLCDLYNIELYYRFVLLFLISNFTK